MPNWPSGIAQVLTRVVGFYPMACRCTPAEYLLMVDPRYSAELLECEKITKRANKPMPKKEQQLILQLGQ